MRQYPVVFWRNFGLGALAAVALVVGAIGYYQVVTPVLRPTLQLVSDVVPAGGSLGFVQAQQPARACPQESSRIIWWWETPDRQRAQMQARSNVSPTPRVWDGPTVVNLPLPSNLAPGTYYYMRETTSWCSVFNYLLARPTIERTASVRFEVVSPPLTPLLR